MEASNHSCEMATTERGKLLFLKACSSSRVPRKANRREGIASTRDCSAAAPPSIQSKQNPTEHQSQQLNAILFTTTTARHTDIGGVYELADATDGNDDKECDKDDKGKDDKSHLVR